MHSHFFVDFQDFGNQFISDISSPFVNLLFFFNSQDDTQINIWINSALGPTLPNADSLLRPVARQRLKSTRQSGSLRLSANLRLVRRGTYGRSALLFPIIPYTMKNKPNYRSPIEEINNRWLLKYHFVLSGCEWILDRYPFSSYRPLPHTHW